MDCVIGESCYKDNFSKEWSFFFHSFVKFHDGKKIGVYVNVLYPEVSEYDQEMPQSQTNPRHHISKSML